MPIRARETLPKLTWTLALLLQHMFKQLVP